MPTTPSSPQPENKKSRSFSDNVEIAENVAEFFQKDDTKVIHCSKCSGAEANEKYTKAATIFSLGALIVSLVSVGMQLLKSPSSVEMKDIEKLFERMQNIVPSSAAANPQSNVNTGKLKTSSSAAVVVSSSSSTVAMAIVSSSSSAAAQEEMSSSSSQGKEGMQESSSSSDGAQDGTK